MGEIVGVGLISHAPTIMFDEATRRELNEGKEISLVPGLVRLRTEVFDRLDADTVVMIDSHWENTVEHVLSAHARRSGHMAAAIELAWLGVHDEVHGRRTGSCPAAVAAGGAR